MLQNEDLCLETVTKAYMHFENFGEGDDNVNLEVVIPISTKSRSRIVGVSTPDTNPNHGFEGE